MLLSTHNFEPEHRTIRLMQIAIRIDFFLTSFGELTLNRRKSIELKYEMQMKVHIFLTERR